ncbi:MAG: hypothetical protein IJM25_12825 [Eubacterium sp.]|nr:hypothetical protein [Eubacterium sp.]
MLESEMGACHLNDFFDLNNDGKLDNFESAMKDAFILHCIEESEKDLDRQIPKKDIRSVKRVNLQAGSVPYVETIASYFITLSNEGRYH